MLSIFYIVFSLLLWSSVNAFSMHTWEYELLDTFYNSTNTNQVEIYTELEKVSRGVWAVSGYIDFKVPITKEFTLRLDGYRSNSGTGEWKRTPYASAPQDAITFFNTIYRHVAMKDMTECSNFPYLPDDWKGPIKAERWVMEKCAIKKDKMPTYLPLGYYKFYFMLEGPTNAYVGILVKIVSAT